MELTITSISENPLLERKEVELELDHTGESTPAIEDVKNRFAAENDVEPEKIDVESVKTAFGSNLSTATIKVYQEFEYEEDLEESQKEEQPTSQETEVEETEEQEEETGDEEETESEEQETEDSETDYDEIVDNTIGDAKDALKDLDEPDFEAALEAEKDNKDRKTFKEWLEGKVE